MKEEVINIKKLESLIKETSGASLSISPSGDEWSAYFLQRKKKVSHKDFKVLVDILIEDIESNRDTCEVTNRNKKPYRINERV